jgi:hypothetical protein
MISMPPRYQTRRSAFESEVQVRASHPRKARWVGQLHSLVAKTPSNGGWASPDRTYVSARRAQGEVRVEEKLTTNLKRLLFPC